MLGPLDPGIRRGDASLNWMPAFTGVTHFSMPAFTGVTHFSMPAFTGVTTCATPSVIPAEAGIQARSASQNRLG